MEAGKSGSEYFSLKSRAGLLKARFNQESCFAEAEIPFNFHVHSRGIPSEEVLQSQAELQRQLKNIQTSYPIASIVNGMNFVLVELTTLEELSHVSKGSTNLEFESDYLDTGWNRDILDIYFFTILSYQDGITKIRARMIDSAIGEDPATGSAASALACYLSHMVARGQSIQIYEIEQGVEMGRRSLIKVRVELNETGIVKQVILSGQAVKVQKGKILI